MLALGWPPLLAGEALAGPGAHTASGSCSPGPAAGCSLPGRWRPGRACRAGLAAQLLLEGLGAEEEQEEEEEEQKEVLLQQERLEWEAQAWPQKRSVSALLPRPQKSLQGQRRCALGCQTPQGTEQSSL